MINTKTILSVMIASLLTVACIDEKPEDQVKSAKEYLQKKDSNSATIQLKNALQKNPELGEARFLLGTILLKEGNAPGAEVEFRKALSVSYPENLVAPELARALLQQGQAKKLIERYASTHFEQPAAEASLQTTLAAAYRSVGSTETSEARLADAFKADPNYVPALMLRARQKALSADFDGALSEVDGILSKDSANTEAWKFKGDLLLLGKIKAEEALVAYRKSIEVEPSFEPGHLAVLTILLQQNKLEDASKQLDQLKKFAAKKPQTKLMEAQLAYQKKDYKAAKVISQELIRLAPKNPRVLQLAGAVELQTNSLAQAETYLVLATEAEPQSVLSQKLLITTYLRSGQAAKALSALKAITGKQGLDSRFFSVAGDVYLQNGDAKTAGEYFAKALKQDPGNVATRTALAVSHLATGQGESGLNELQDIADSDSGTMADMALISAHLKRKDFEKALAAVAKLESKQADKPLAANLRGRIQLAQKDPAAARKSFERALSIDPTYFAAAASLASLDMVDKKPADAKKRFENILAKNPKSGPALIALAELAAMQEGGKQEIPELLAKAIEANPTESTPRLMLIGFLLKEGDNKQALATAQKAVAANPNSPELLEALGRTQEKSGDLNQAVATYQNLTAMRPLVPEYHARLAAAQLANKNVRAAEQSTRDALQIKPDDAQVQRMLVVVLLQGNKADEALKVASNAIAQQPKSAVGYAMEGDVRAWQKNWEKAAAAYRSGLQLSPSSELAAKLYNVMSVANNPDEAGRFADSWIKAHPTDAAFLAHMGDGALARKDFASAEKNYSAVLRLAPNNPIVINNLAWVTHQMGKDGALLLAEKANKLAPNQPAFMDTWAMLLSAAGTHPKAIELQTKATEMQPANESMRLNLAKILIASGDKKRAKLELDKLSKLPSDHPLKPELLKLLDVVG